jgi:CRISPR locus-related DNA-binding protein
MKTFVFTLGFDVTGVVTRLSEAGLEGSEDLVFITIKNDSPRAATSKASLIGHIQILNSRGMRLTHEFVEVEARDSGEDLEAIYDSLSKKQNIVIELTGGMRYIVLLSYMVAQMLGEKVIEVSTRLETDGSRMNLPLLRLAKLTHKDAKILEDTIIPKTQKELAQIHGKKLSNISRSLKSLEQRGLVSRISNHKPILYKTTHLGDIYLKGFNSSRIGNAPQQKNTF